MRYTIEYVCVSHIGKVREENQDNFICNRLYVNPTEATPIFPICGRCTSARKPIFGVFDGMGGEECGDIAAFIASDEAAKLQFNGNSISTLSRYCRAANDAICHYAQEHHIASMGTTAAMLAFANDEITLCNIGDSKIFRYSHGALEQISVDHVYRHSPDRKPLLTQNLGIPPDEFEIIPYFAQGFCEAQDIYLICSDGLTDMVSVEEIKNILCAHPIRTAAESLLEKALANGGKDNITLLLCKVLTQVNHFLLWKRN